MTRTVIALTGADRAKFLGDLVTNTLPNPGEGLAYAALLTPQGKFIADFFVLAEEGRLLIDVASSHAPTLVQRLTLYRLRADVAIAQTDLKVGRGLGAAPAGAHQDPRDAALGWRHIAENPRDEDHDWDALRVAQLIPETGIELTPDTYILEAGFERLHGVDFKKGCFVGQEIVARMKHKTTLKKGLVRLSINGAAPPGTAILMDGKTAGTLFTQSGGMALAHMRFDRMDGPLQAGAATLARA